MLIVDRNDYPTLHHAFALKREEAQAKGGGELGGNPPLNKVRVLALELALEAGDELGRKRLIDRSSIGIAL